MPNQQRLWLLASVQDISQLSHIACGLMQVSKQMAAAVHWNQIQFVSRLAVDATCDFDSGLLKHYKSFQFNSIQLKNGLFNIKKCMMSYDCSC